MSMVILVTGYSSELDIYYNYVGGVGRAGSGRLGPGPRPSTRHSFAYLEDYIR